MAVPTKAMHQIRQILELRQQQVSLRKIERLTSFSRNTVRDYIRRAITTGRSLVDLLALGDTELACALSGEAVPVYSGVSGSSSLLVVVTRNGIKFVGEAV